MTDLDEKIEKVENNNGNFLSKQPTILKVIIGIVGICCIGIMVVIALFSLMGEVSNVETFDNGKISFNFSSDFTTINDTFDGDVKLYTRLMNNGTVININEATKSDYDLSYYYQDIKNAGTFSGSNPNTGYTQVHTPIYFKNITIDNTKGVLSFHEVETKENGITKNYYEFVLLFVKNNKVYMMYGSGFDRELLENSFTQIIETYKTY